jgi:large subunit ribosomal protein L18e
MIKPTGPTNPIIRKEIRFLFKSYRKFGSPIWKLVGEKLSIRKRGRIKVNVGKINKLTKENEFVVVPGKVLGFGILDHAVNVAALSFSNSAKRKIEEAKGKCLSFEELISLNPKGSNVKVLT